MYTRLYKTWKISFFNHLQNIIKIELNIAIGDKIISLYPYVGKFGLA